MSSCCVVVMLIYLVVGLVLSVLLYAVNVLSYQLSRTRSSNSLLVQTYECGYETIANQARTQHSLDYYIIALLYVVFDLELALVLPAIVSINVIGTVGTMLLVIIMTLLCLAFVYELSIGVL